MQWTDVARELGHTLLAAALPAVIPCPSCGAENLTVFHDNLGGGYWHYCFGCGARGDLVQLCGLSWQASIPVTVRRLVTRELLTNLAEAGRLEEYEQWLHGADCIYRFTDSLQSPARNSESPGVQRFRQLHNLYLASSRQRWTSGPGTLLGFATLDELEQQLNVSQAGRKLGRRVKLTGHRDWDGAIVIPYCDLPGRPRAFGLLGPDGELLFRRVEMFDALGPHNRESGFGMLRALYDAAASWKDAVVLTDQPLLAIKLQLKNFAESARPLPLLLVRPEDKSLRYSLELLRGRNVIIWIPHRHDLPPLLVRLAAQAGAKLSQVGPATGDLANWISHAGSPADLLQRVIVRAKPWNDVLCAWSAGRKAQDVQWLLAAMDVHPGDLERMAAGAGDGQLAALAKVLDGHTVPRRVIYRGSAIFERDESWTVEKASGDVELICDAVLRIDRVIHRTATAETYYQGRIRYHRRDLEYCELRSVVEANPLDWMQTKLLGAQMGFLRCNPSWTKHIVPLAVQFQAPKLVQGDSLCGWDSQQGVFSFAHYRLHPGGAVEPVPLLLPGKVPGPQQALEPLSQELREWLAAQSPEATATVALMAAITANLLAPAFNEPVRNIALETVPLTNFCTHLAEQLGCLRISQWGPEEPYTHGWPVIDDTGTQDKVLRVELDRRFPAGRLVGIEEDERFDRMMSGHWQLLINRHQLSVLDCRREGVEQLIPNYLQYLALRQMQPGGSRFRAPQWHIYVLRSIHQFLQEQGCPMDRARTERWFVDTSTTGLGLYVLELLTDACEEYGLAIVSARQATSIPRDALRQHPRIGPYIKDIDRLLRHAKVLYRRQRGRVSWAVKTPLWKKACRNRLKYLMACVEEEPKEA